MSLEHAIAYALSVVETAPAAVPDHSPASDDLILLTSREQEIAVLIARGFTNSQIAAELRIAQRTVDTHVSHILSKLHVTSRLGVAAVVTERGLVAEHKP